MGKHKSKSKSKSKTADGKLVVAKARKKVKAKAKMKVPKQQCTVKDLLQKVEECVESFQYEEAVRLCERALRLAPRSVQVLETAGPILLEVGETARGEECLRAAIELSPEEGHLKYLYLGQMGEGEEAVSYLRKGIEIMTRELHTQQSQSVGVEEACASVPAVEGDVSAQDLSVAYCSLAEVYLTDSCFAAEAEQRCYECCSKAIDHCPTNPEAYQLMASCLLSKNELEEAKRMLLKGVSLWLPRREEAAPEETATATHTPQECDLPPHESGSACDLPPQESVSVCDPPPQESGSACDPPPQESGSECDPPPYSSRVSCAKLLLELGEYSRACDVLEGLLQEDDEVVQVWYLMGWLHHLTHNQDSARFFLEQAKELFSKVDCDDTELLEHTRELLQELGPQLPDGGGEGSEEDSDREDTMDVT